MNDSSRSPLKDKPLRMPGQSLEEERAKLFEDKVMPAFLTAAVATIIAVAEWIRYFTKSPPNPLLYSFLAVIAVGFLIWRVIRLLPRSRAIKQGIEGEKVVGQFLERLRGQGYVVFHDLIGSGFNVDHVLIGPAGIYTVETKTWSKPVRGEAKIKFDGEQITVSGHEPERDPIIQARAQVAWLRGLLAESTGKQFDVFPVVVFPGWYIDRTKDGPHDIWVLEPKALPGFLDKIPQRLAPDEIKLASFHLSRFIRSVERESAK